MFRPDEHPGQARNGVVLLMSGTVASQVLMVGSTPILSRIYDPEAFGLLAVFTSILLSLGVIASLRYNVALPLPRHEREAGRLLTICIAVLCINTCLVAILTWGLAPTLHRTLDVPGLAPALWLLPIGFFAHGLHDVIRQWTLRTRHYGTMAQARMLQSASTAASQMGSYALDPFGLPLGVVVGRCIATLRLGRGAWLALRAAQATSLRRLLRTAHSYRGFPLLSTGTGLLNTGAAQLPPLAIAALLGSTPAGLFAITHRILSAPMIMIGKAVGDVFYTRASKAHRSGNLASLMLTTYVNLVTVGIPAALLGVFAAPDVLGPFLGTEWLKVGKLAQVMVPWLFMQFVTTPPTRVFPVIDRHGVALQLQLSLFTASIVAIALGSAWLNDLFATVLLLSMSNALIYGTRLQLAFSMVGVPFRTVLHVSGKPIAIGSLVVLPYVTLKLASHLVEIPSYALLSAFIVSLTAFLGIVYRVARSPRSVAAP